MTAVGFQSVCLPVSPHFSFVSPGKETIMASTTETHTIHLQVICRNQPPIEQDNRPTEFGLQDKKTELLPGKPLPDGAVAFQLDLQATRQPETDQPRFRGAYVHGTPSQFLYLGWRHAGEPTSPWIKRIKIPLATITWQQIQGLARSGAVLQASVDGSGAATVRLLDNGWAPI